MSRKEQRMWGIGFGIFLVCLWQALAVLIGKPFLLPGPADVIVSLWENRIEIFTVHFPATMEVMVLGALISISLGALLAILMDWDSRIRRAVYPILTVTQTIPVMCIAPVFVLWMGYTIRMRVVVVVLLTFFSVTVNLFDGFQASRPERAELLKTYGADRKQIFRLLRMPTALPYFFTALRIALPWSVVGAAVSEWLGAPSGLGTYSRSCMMNLDAAGLLAPLLVLTAVALLLNSALHWLEVKMVPWRGES